MSRTIKRSILDHFPYPQARAVQEAVLLEIEKNWNKVDCFALVCPTASGKSALAYTIASWAGQAQILTPNNLLLDQYADEFDKFKVLKGIDTYSSAGPVQGQINYWKAYEAYWESPIRATNFALYSTHLMLPKLWNIARKSPLIVDEAHNLIPFLTEDATQRVWQHKQDFPYHAPTDRDELKTWVAELKKKNGAVETLEADLFSPFPTHVLENGYDTWRAGGKLPWDNEKMIRGEEYEIPALFLKPTNIKGQIDKFLPRERGSKTILMSATINQTDLRTLGLDRKKVMILECPSPIPAEKRPIHIDPVAFVTKDNFAESTKKIADHLVDMSGYMEGKGLVHATYEQARELKKHLGNVPRFLFHTAETKKRVYEKFRASKEPHILIGSGMYEGLDLSGGDYKWQVIAKIPWKSLGDAAIKWKADEDPDWYLWETWKDVIQACGRICRTPTDYGETIIIDGTIERLLEAGSHLLPKWFEEAIT